MNSKLARRITAEDIYGFTMVSDPAYSPNGDSVAYVVTRPDKESNGYHSSICVTDASGNSRTLTRASARDNRPQWSPDGATIAFLSNRSESKQVWMIKVRGGEAWQVTSFEDDITDFCWSHDGSQLAVVSRKSESDEDKKPDDDHSDVKHITQIRYKSDDEGFLDPRPRNIWVLDADGSNPRQITNSDVHDLSPVWSPTGQEIAFVTNRSADRMLNTVSEIWSVNVDSGVEQRLIGGDNASFGSPTWSPDGSKVAAVGHWEANAGGGPDSKIWIVEASGGDPVCLTPEFERSTDDSAMSDMFQASSAQQVWTNDGTSIFFIASDSGGTEIYRADLESKTVDQVTTAGGRVSGITIDHEGTSLAYVWADATNPGDLFEASISAPNERQQVTTVNSKFFADLALSTPEEFRVQSADGTSIQGWIMKPVNFDPAVKYPMILQIHGGPHGMYADAFMHEFQLMAARGYVVLYCNPRGSSGYGEAFTRASHANWGEADLPDLMAAVDFAIDQGYVDEKRLGITGGSYGGYMTLWTIGHSKRFKAAVAQRSVSNLYSFYGTSDIGWTFGEFEFDGNPWERRDHFMKYSPISYVQEMTTPLLLIHSERDFRCPIEQSEQVFISLKRLGRNVEFVRFPDENHNLSRSGKPKHRIERLEHIIGWFDRHL